MSYKKNNLKKIYKQIAKKHGISVEEVKREMRSAIETARNNPNPNAQAEFSRRFGDRTPTPEELIIELSKGLGL